MTAQRNIGLAVARYVAIDVIGDIIYFPLWWYSGGLKLVTLTLYDNARTTARNLSLRLLLINIFNPMFGHYDRAGRIISFFMRILIVLVKSIYFVIKAAVLLALLLLWVLLPLAVAARVWQIFRY